VTSRRMRWIILLLALAALATTIQLALVAEALDVFDHWSPPDD
jgi:cytochrome c-type biogenesis protein CcmE